MGPERNSPLLLGLTDDEVAELLGIAERRAYQAGDLVVQEGTTSDCLFIVDEGAVRVEKEDGGKPVLLAILDHPGDFFGEMSLIDILPRSANIRADRETSILAFPKRELTGFFSRSPRVQMTMILNIARNLSIRLREADERILQLSRGLADA